MHDPHEGAPKHSQVPGLRSSIRILGSLLILNAVLGLVLTYIYSQQRSMERNTWALGLSKERLAIGFICLAIALAMAWAGSTLLKRLETGTFPRALVSVSGSENWLALTIALGIAAPLLLGAAAAFISGPILSEGHLLKIVFSRIRPLLIWGVALVVEAAVYLVGVFVALHRPNRATRARLAGKALVIATIATTTPAQWAYSLFLPDLTFSSQTLDPISAEWFRPGLAIAFLVIIVVASAWLMMRPQLQFKYGLAVILAAYCIQLGFAVADGGISSFPRRVRSLEGHNDYAETASTGNLGLLDIIDYEARYGSDGFLSTKPPGVLALHILLEKSLRPWNPHLGSTAMFTRMTDLIGYCFPLLSSLTALAIYAVSSLLGNNRLGVGAGLVYSTIPSVAVNTWSLDQTLYPILFLGGIALGLFSLKLRSTRVAITAGVYAYLCGFVSFSLLPLLPFLLAILVLSLLLREARPLPITVGKLAFSMVGGFLTAALAGYLFLNYNMVIRLTNALQSHQAFKHFQPALVRIPEAALRNLGELSVWFGMPLLLFTFYRLVVAASRAIKADLTFFDLIALAFGATILGMIIVGQTDAEVSRLWLFLAPVCALLASDFVRTVFGDRLLVLPGMVAGQLIGTLVIFTYQYPY